jgi:hypothetical protein
LPNTFEELCIVQASPIQGLRPLPYLQIEAGSAGAKGRKRPSVATPC